jgi:ACS family hexuronate transporter-like MFS transporter
MTATPRSASWKWWIAGLLLTATMINYLDRQTLSILSVRITKALSLSEEQYGNLEFAFGWAFAVGSLGFGFLVDRINVRWLYPTVLLGWSLSGIATGFATTYEELFVCRTVLGLFEAGHWPCALTTIQRVMLNKDRHLGNSMLQSGAAFGAILTPPVVLAIIRWADPGEAARTAHLALGGGMAIAATGPAPTVWNLPFIIVGAVGSIWVFAWLALIRTSDLQSDSTVDTAKPEAAGNWWKAFLDPRFWALFVVVVCLNTTWQLIRAWLPKFMQNGRGYSETDALLFNSAFYISADVGCLISGTIALWLGRRGWNVHRTRIGVYVICSLLAALTAVAAVLPKGDALLVVLLLTAAGALGLFPCYYSFVQELSRKHLGKVSGMLAGLGWFLSSPLQKAFGRWVDYARSYDLPFALTGLVPMIGAVALLVLWRKERGGDANPQSS